MKKLAGLCLLIGFLFVGCWLDDLFNVPTADTDSSSSGSSSGGTTATTGTLQISADSYAYIYVNGTYEGQGSAFLTLNPGSYTVDAYAPSTGQRCWETKTTVYAGKNSVVKNNSYCR